MTSRQRAGVVAVGLCAAASASLAAWVVWGFVPAVAALAATLGGFALVLACGWAGAVIGVAFFLMSPGVLGESSLIRSLAGAAAIVAALLLSGTDRQSRGTIPAVAVAVVGVAMVASGSAPVEIGGLYAGLAVAAFLLATRPHVAAAGLRAVTLIVAALTVGYLTTWAVGFDHLAATLSFDGRRYVDVYAPLALTGSGTPLWDGAPPRMLLATGEPGLNVFYLLAAFATLGHHGRRARLWLAVVLVAGAVVSQSAGLLVALLAGVGAAAFVALVRRGRVALAVALAAAGGYAVVRVALRLVDLRAAGSSETVADRGLAAGSLTSASLGNINLIAALQNDLTLGAGLVVALALLAKTAAGTPSGAFAWTAFAVTAVFAQPSQWQAGGWLLLAMVALTRPGHQDDDSGQVTVTLANDTRMSSLASNLPK